MAIHPWLKDLDWFVEAADELLAHIGPEGAVEIELERGDDGRGFRTKAKVTVRNVDPDELDDMPGIRRIERRSYEIAPHLPTTAEMTAHIEIKDGDWIANVHDGSGVLVTLVAHRRRDGGWNQADSIVMPRRLLDPPLVDMAARDPWIVTEASRILGDERLRKDAQAISLHHRSDMLQIILPAGSVLSPERAPSNSQPAP